MSDSPKSSALGSTSRSSTATPAAKLGRKDLKFTNPAAIVTLILESKDEETKFVVHREFACNYSPVFRAAFNSEFIEGKTGIYKLVDTSESAVQHLVQWFYHQDFEVDMSKIVEIVAKGIVVNDTVVKDTVGKETLTLVQLWILADRLLIPRLQNFVFQKLFELQVETKIVSTKTFNYVYKNTSDGSPFRLLFVHQAALRRDKTWFTRYKDQFPKNMLLDIITVLKVDDATLYQEVIDKSIDILSRYYVSEDDVSKRGST